MQEGGWREKEMIEKFFLIVYYIFVSIIIFLYIVFLMLLWNYTRLTR